MKSYTVKLDFQLPPALIACVLLHNLYTMMQSQFLSTSLSDVDVNAKYDFKEIMKIETILNI